MAILEAVFANKPGQTPQEVERRRRMAQALIESGAGGKPPSSGLELAGRLAMTLTGQYQAGKAEREDAANRANASSLLANTLLGTPGQTGGSMPAVSPSGQIAAKPTSSEEWNTIAPRLVSDLSRDLQLSPEQAAGVVGQLGHESAGFSTLQEQKPMVTGSKGGFGYAQWTGPRRRQFEDWASANNLDPTSYEANYGFLKNELTNSPEAKVVASLRAAPDAQTAGRVFTDQFLRPGIPGYDSRSNWTNKALAFAKPQEVASLDQSIGMPGAASEVQRTAPQPPSNAMVSTASNQPAQAPQLPPPVNVASAPVPPNAPSTPAGLMSSQIPAEFQGSAQLMNADPGKGILPVLLGGSPASQEQVAQARALGNQPQQAPAQADRRAQIAALLQNPYTQEAGQQLLMQEYQRQQMDSDPLRQLQIQQAQLELEQARNPEKKRNTAVVNGVVVDTDTGKPIYQAPPKEEAKPAAVQEYEYAKSQGFPGTFQDWEASKKGGMSLQVDPATGAVSFQQGGNIKPMTEAQSKDTTFATRAEGALPAVDKFGDALTSFGESVGGNAPLIGNYMKSPEYQQAEQAGKEFLQGILRKDTGAAITREETEEYGSVYLPRPGDSPQLLAQKKLSRRRAIDAMKAGMTPQAILAQEKAMANTALPTEPPAAVAPAPSTQPGAPQQSFPGAPPVGAVEDGYRYKGGDPKDPASWEQVL